MSSAPREASSSPWEFPLPDGWIREPAKYNTYMKGRLGWQKLVAAEYTNEGPLIVSSEQFSNDAVDWHRCNRVPRKRFEMAPEIILKEHDVLLMKDGAAMGKLAYVDHLPEEACLNSHLLLFRPLRERSWPRFLYYILKSRFFEAYMIDQRSGATFFGFSQASMGNFPLSLPPVPEQRAIADFLDRETGKIDALVAKKERLIELLQEKRTALITHAVTKGLDPNAPTKPSGVVWLGDIPAHWKVVRSKRLFSLRKTKALPDDEQLTASQEYGVIPQKDFMAKAGRSVVQVITGADILKHVEPNDFVISMRSFQGGLEISRHRGSISSAYVMVIPASGTNCMYFSYAFKSATYIQALQSTSNLVRDGQALRFENFSLVDLPVIGLEEQQAIARFLDEETMRIDSLMKKVKEAIERLKEFRTALISAAVTGKIDVREETS